MLDYKRIGLYGGTFNPPHIGHIQAAKSAAEQLRLDLLLLTPSALPPHKELPDQSPDGEARMEMLRMASKGLCCAEADDTELRRGGKSYTVHTLEQLQERYPGAEFWLLVGTDMFLTLQDWYQSERILSMVRVAVFPRASQPRLPAIERQRQYLTAAYGARVDVVVNTAVDISSSHLRELLAQGLGREYLHPDVYNYIACWGLYGMRAGREPVRDLDGLRSAALSMLAPKRVPHVLGCEEEAVKLAGRWGADPEKARIAALLHDCTKRLELPQQLQLCRQYGIILDKIEETANKLLHAKTGATIARENFGVSDEVYGAIYWHTTGKADMTLLEKVIYLADYIEPSRVFPGVEELRALAYRDLDSALLRGLEMTVEEMKEKGSPVHPATVRAQDWLKGKTNA